LNLQRPAAQDRRMREILLLCLLVSSTPALAQSRPDPKATEINGLIAALHQAPDEAQAGAIENRLRQLWLQAGTPVTTMLMVSGVHALGREAPQDAVEDFNAALALEPDLADAYEQRALARFRLGDYAGAIADIEATLKRQPLDFSAIEVLSRIAEAHGDAQGALAAWQRALQISPMTPGGAARLQLLTIKAQGEPT
jgi:tetratricopeptide (TPR) repeat protein